MNFLMTSWRKFLNEGNSEDIDQLSKMMGHSVEETIVQHIMIGEWRRAWNHFRGWYMEGKVDLELLVETLDDLLQDEYRRIRKNMINTDWKETLTSAVKFVTGGEDRANAFLNRRGSANYPDRYTGEVLNQRIYEPRMRMPWQESPKDMLYAELRATILRNDIKIREKPNETPT